ncbi:NTP transferase domain-containing protein [Streptosporangiaceae bacterium NEAU-GS5]|nr:NTP transferase domain-containing protein [Streptosporangiaceae bacterium NEAU-GS5]
MIPRHDAVILAGGRARRLGGRDKPGELVGGRPLIERVAAAVPYAERLVVVGERRAMARADVIFSQEEPPGSGPVPALRAGLAHVAAGWVALLAADMPFLRGDHVEALFAAAEAAGAVLVDGEGRRQWLAGVWRREPLSAALEGYRGESLRGLLGPLRAAQVHLAAKDPGREPWTDCDTMEDLERARGGIE